MKERRLLALGGLLCLALTAGCFGPSEIPESDLRGENVTYDWETDAEAAYTLSRSSYQAVYNASNRTTLSIHDRDALGVESPVRIGSLQFRFTNGTIVNATHANLSATIAQRRTTIGLPARHGQVAYTADRSGKQFSTPVAVEGPQAVTLPPGARVGAPVLSQVSPGNYSTAVADDRMTVRWANVTDGALTVHYYLQRDLVLFSLLLLVTLSLAVGGSLYYVRQIRRLEARREAIAPDVDQDEDDPRDRGPPPGMG